MTPEPALNSLATDGDAAFTELAGAHYENFPVGSWLVPKALRPHVHRIYAFARTADDLADELQDAAALERFRQSFVAHCERKADDVPLFSDLVASMRDKGLPRQLFLDLLDAFAEDLVRLRHDEKSLMSYCERSANPIGRLVLRVFGHEDDRLDAWSDSICTGLQILNHLQDVGEDWRQRRRVYLPKEDLERFAVADEDLAAARATPELRALIAHWTRRTAGMLAAGWPLVLAVRGRLRLELRAILCSAAAVLDKIASQDHDVLVRPARLSRAAKAKVLLRALCLSGPPPALCRAR